MFPRPRLRAGLSRPGRIPQRPSAPAATRRPLQPLQARAVARPRMTAAAATKPKPEAADKQYFAVLYAKNSRKKRKSWLDGYVVLADDRYVALHNEDGKHVLSERAPRLGGLVEGNTLELRSWVLEVQNPVAEADFISGRLFLKNAVVAVARPPPRQICPFKPLRRRGEKSAPAPARSLHDPKAPGAVVLADGDTPVVLDPCLARRMRPHQITGVKFLLACVRPSGGAILADDMGLGKSLQAIALIWTLLRQGGTNAPLAAKSVIVCPASLVTNWVNEVKKWLGEDRLRPVAVASGNSTFESKQALAAFINGSVKKLLIVSYEMFRSYAEELYRANVGLLICDEGHRLKSSQGNKTIEALRKLPCRRRVILTGTPVQNDLEEFFAVCDFVNPGRLNTLQSFRSVFASPIIASRDSNASPSVVQLGEARAKELGKLTSKFVLRRTSTILEGYLPAKLETAIFCRLQPNQEQAYEQEARHRFADMDTTRFSAALSAINHLRKICSHPVLVKSMGDSEDEICSDEERTRECEFADEKKDNLQDFDVNDSSKMQIAVSICEASLEVGDRVIFVSNFTSTLDLVQDAFSRSKIKFCRLDGGTPVNKRGDIVRRFNSGTLGDIFLLSAKAGGVGLNLIGANRLILFDPDWNPATDLQAMARIWRDGQKKRVFVYRLLSTGTIEEKIFQRQLFKGELQSAVDADTGGADVRNVAGKGVFGGKEGNFSAEQLRDLFQYNGRLDFCETLQVLQRSQMDISREDSPEEDFDVVEVKQDGLLKKFSGYKERFEAEKGVKDYVFCDEDDVLDKAINRELKTHGLVSYLYTQRSGSTGDGGNKYQATKVAVPVPKKERQLRHKEEVGRSPVPRKRRKVERMFADESDKEEESDAELAAMEATAERASKRRFERGKLAAEKAADIGGRDMQPLSGGDTRELEAGLETTDIPAPKAAKQDPDTAAESGVEHSENNAGAVNTWDEAVEALDLESLSSLI